MEEDRGNKPSNEIFSTASSALRGVREKVLDVGCGDGYFALYVKEKFRRIYGAEIVQEAAHVAQKQGMFTTVMDLNSSLSYKDNTFDTVTCLDVIEHVLDPVSLLTEISRVLMPGGQLVLTTPNIRYFRNLYKLIFKGKFPHTTPDTFVWGGGHLHFFTRADIKNIFKKAGFKRIEFFINQNQFRLSKKRKIIRFLTGERIFGEWFNGSITLSAYKES
jgi:methionine biosynthesis protein MetW